MIELEETLCRLEDRTAPVIPFGTSGRSQIVRAGDNLFATAIQPGGDSPWVLWCRAENGWSPVQQLDSSETQSPPGLAALPGARIIVSLSGQADCGTRLLEFSADDPEGVPRRILPAPPAAPDDDLERSSGTCLAADGRTGQALLLLHSPGESDDRCQPLYWGCLDPDRTWRRSGHLSFPINVMRTSAALRDGAAHMVAAGVTTPVNNAGHLWGTAPQTTPPVSRRLFYGRCADTRKGNFDPPVEIDSVEATCGRIGNLDLWLSPDGSTHLLYLRENICDPALRDRKWPSAPLVTSLEHAVLKEGILIHRRTLMTAVEPHRHYVPEQACFHEDAAGNARVICSVRRELSGEGRCCLVRKIGSGLSGNGEWKELNVRTPPVRFSCSTGRVGARRSDVVEMLGMDSNEQSVRYLRIAA